MPARKPRPERHRAAAHGNGEPGLVISARKVILWGAVVAGLVTIGSACYATVSYVDSRYLLRVVGEKYQVSNCIRFEAGRQATVEDAISKLEIQRDEAARDRRVQFTTADRQTLERWIRQRRTEREIRESCIEETKRP